MRKNVKLNELRRKSELVKHGLNEHEHWICYITHVAHHITDIIKKINQQILIKTKFMYVCVCVYL